MAKPLNPDDIAKLLGLPAKSPSQSAESEKPSPEGSNRGLSAADIQALLASESQKEERVVRSDNFYKHGFDKAALFLLDLQFENLFEPWITKLREDSDGWWWRCKGCRRQVKRTGRKSHYDWHKRELLS